MPRNPNKRRCQTPGCKAYAMRNLGGGTRSKPGQSKLNASWTEAELFSPRPAVISSLAQAGGLPPAAQPIGPSWSKLNTSWRSCSSRSAGSSRTPVKTGRHAHPVSVHKLDLLAHKIAKNPSQTPAILSRELYALQDRTGDAYLTLILASRLARQLLPLVTDQIFHIELYHLLQNFPPASRPKVEAVIRHETLPLNPLERLTVLRDADKYLRSIINNLDNKP